MQFTDMAQVRSVDKDMLDRTRAWLLPGAMVTVVSA